MIGAELVAKSPPDGYMNSEIVRSLNHPDVKAKIANLGLEIVANTPDEFAAYLLSEIVKWAKVVKDSVARAD